MCGPQLGGKLGGAVVGRGGSLEALASGGGAQGGLVNKAHLNQVDC